MTIPIDRTLVIIPNHPDLIHLDDELTSLSSSLNCEFLHGDQVSEANLLARIKSGPRDGKPGGWNILWFASHGNAEGILLSDSVLTYADLAPVVRGSGATLLVLNSCDSRYIAMTLHYELGITVVAAIGRVGDALAAKTMGWFAEGLRKYQDPYEAFQLAGPNAQLNYEIFPKQGKPSVSDTTTRPTDTVSQERRLELLEWTVFGNQTLGMKGCKPVLEELINSREQDKIDRNRFEMELMSKRMNLEKHQRWAFYLMSFIAFISVVLQLALTQILIR